MFFKKISSEYRIIGKKGQGTFSEVLKAQCLKTSKYVAIKCMKNTFESVEQMKNLREIQALQRLSPHANIIKLLEILYDQPAGRLALVFELMDMNLYEMIRGRKTYISEERVKCYMYQLIKAIDHMHQVGIFHRDIKPENILITDEVLKLADFGSCRGIHSKQPYTEYISTRWYRAPECLLTDGYYNYKMDMWGVGCVIFEIVSLFPLFPGNNELEQIQKIHNILGTPPQQLLDKMKRRSRHADFSFPQQDGTGIARLIPHASPGCVELINKLLTYNPEDRWSARQALRHTYFKELRERDKLQQAFLNASTRSLRTSPRLGMQDIPACKSRLGDVGKTSLVDRTNVHGGASLSQQIANGVRQCFILSDCNKLKETENGCSHLVDTLTLPLHGPILRMYSSQLENTNSYRGLDDGITDACLGFPHVKNNTSSPQKFTAIPTCSVQRTQGMNDTPKIHTTSNSAKVLKGVKNHRASFPDLSPKGAVGGMYKPGEPPPYKRRANTKYVSPYSQRYMG